MKRLTVKFILKFLAIIDIVFAGKFELRIYRNGELKCETKYCKLDINKAYKQTPSKGE